MLTSTLTNEWRFASMSLLMSWRLLYRVPEVNLFNEFENSVLLIWMEYAEKDSTLLPIKLIEISSAIYSDQICLMV